jgi:hypothetical protein
MMASGERVRAFSAIAGRCSKKLALISLTMFLFLSSAVEAAEIQPGGRLDIVGEILTSSDMIPQWCYETDPSLVFVEGRSLYRANLSGQKTLLQMVDAPIDDLTLRCSSDGKIIFFLSAQHEFAYIIQDGVESKYELRKDFTDISVRYGSLMSPDGSAFVLGVMRLVRGPDALAEKRVLDLNSGDIFWMKEYVVHPPKTTSSIRSQELYVFERRHGNADDGDRKRTTLRSDVLVDNIEQCSPRKYVITSWLQEDNRSAEMFTLDRPNARVRLLPGRVQGELNASAGGCLLPLMREDRGATTATDLLLLAGDSMRTFKLPAATYFSSRFYLSKDLKYVMTYVPPPGSPSEQIPGRIVVLQIIPLVK